MTKTIIKTIATITLSAALLTTPALADTLRNSTSSYDYAKGYSASDCWGGHIVPVYPNTTAHGLKAFKLKPGTTAIWSWYTAQGTRVGWKKLSSTDKCHKLHGDGLKDKILVKRA